MHFPREGQNLGDKSDSGEMGGKGGHTRDRGEFHKEVFCTEKEIAKSKGRKFRGQVFLLIFMHGHVVFVVVVVGSKVFSCTHGRPSQGRTFCQNSCRLQPTTFSFSQNCVSCRNFFCSFLSPPRFFVAARRAFRNLEKY